MSLPRLLAGVGPDAMSYAQHARVHGELPLETRRAIPGSASSLLQEIERSGLRGRGGGGFPLITKLAAVRRARGRPIVVVNGTEGEPMSAKDRVLLESLPHLVIDGAICCARALGTDEIVIAIDECFDEAGHSLELALAERPDLIRGMRPRLVDVPSGYVTGQESALVSFLNDRPAKPTSVEPRISERGVGNRPTLMSNAETLAHVALIVRHGARWFRRLGTSDEPGSVLVTLTGAVAQPGVFEIESGSQIRSLLRCAGGLTEPARAFLVGGYAGGWIDGGVAPEVGLARDSLRAFHTSVGAGVVVALGQSVCPVAEVTRVAGWMADQSAGQCGPCVHGLSSIADALADVGEGSGGRAVLDDIRRWARLVVGRGACAHPDGAARFVSTAVGVFYDEFADHAEHGQCAACEAQPVLMTPRQARLVR